MELLDEVTLSQKIAFLIEVQAWITSTALTGHAYLPITARQEWVEWASHRIEHLLKLLNEH